MSVQNIDFKKNKTADTTRNPSMAIWADCPVLAIKEDPGIGLNVYDDFVDLPLPPTLTTQIAFGKYKGFATSGDTIVRVSAVNSVTLQGGALSLTHNTDNNSASFAQYWPSFFLSGNAAGTSGKLWFECCYAQNSIITALASTFIGLFETQLWTLATAVPLTGSTDAITNTAAGIGFRIGEASLGVIDTVVTDRATSFTNIGAGEGGTLAANTFKKLGFVYDPDEDKTRRIVFYADNLELTTKYTEANIVATTNLKAGNLGLMIASVAGSAGTSFAAYLKWWRCVQLFRQ